MTNLVSRLRDHNEASYDSGRAIALIDEAADALESLQARYDALLRHHTEMHAHEADQIYANGSKYSCTVQLDCNPFTQETSDWLLEEIIKAVGERDVVLIKSNSRQAQEIRAKSELVDPDE